MEYFPTPKANRRAMLIVLLLGLALGTAIAASAILPGRLGFEAPEASPPDRAQFVPVCARSFLFSSECPQ